MRIVKIDELQFLTCLKHGLWGSRSARFKDWHHGDKLAFIIGKELAAFAEVDGAPFVSRDRVWDNDIFPYRIPIKFVHVLDENDRLPILGPVREALTSAWGVRYGWGILNQQNLPEAAAQVILDEMKCRPNSLSKFLGELSERIEQAMLQRQASKSIPMTKRIRRRRSKQASEKEPAEETSEESSAHTKVQHLLIRLGRAVGCSVWVPHNDRGRIISGGTLGDECLRELPGMGLNQEAARRISYIDVLWIRQGAPVCAFEVETTSTIYSGLLRMSDLLAVVPALKMNLFVVAPQDRQDRALRELSRPTFSKLGLNEYCKFVPCEKLEELVGRVKDLTGHIQHTIVDTIAITLEEEYPEA